MVKMLSYKGVVFAIDHHFFLRLLIQSPPLGDTATGATKPAVAETELLYMFPICDQKMIVLTQLVHEEGLDFY